MIAWLGGLLNYARPPAIARPPGRCYNVSLSRRPSRVPAAIASRWRKVFSQIDPPSPSPTPSEGKGMSASPRPGRERG
ncbi:MAG: hypothetical protein AB1791_01605 [Chloroflexota bacterium]